MVNDGSVMCSNNSSSQRRQHSVRGKYSGLACVHYSARWGTVEFLQYLVQRRGIACSQPWPTSAVAATPAHDAAAAGNWETLRWLLANSTSELGSRDGSGTTVCHLAANYGHLGLLKALFAALDVGGCAQAVRARTNSGAIPLHFAAMAGQLNCVKFLIQRGPSTADSRMNSGATPCYLAAQQGHLNVMRYLLTEGGATVRINAHDGMSCAHAAAQGGHLDMVKFLLIEQKTGINARDSEGNTLLHYAAGQGHAAVTEWLLQNGCVSLPDSTGSTPLHDAAHYGHIQCVRVLLRHKCDANAVDADGFTPSDLATIGKHPACAAAVGAYAKKLAATSNGVVINERLHDNGQRSTQVFHSFEPHYRPHVESSISGQVTTSVHINTNTNTPREVARRPSLCNLPVRAQPSPARVSQISHKTSAADRIPTNSTSVLNGNARAYIDKKRTQKDKSKDTVVPNLSTSTQRHPAPSANLVQPNMTGFQQTSAPIMRTHSLYRSVAPVLTFPQQPLMSTFAAPGTTLTMPQPISALPTMGAPLPIMARYTPAADPPSSTYSAAATQPPAPLLLAPNKTPVLTLQPMTIPVPATAPVLMAPPMQMVMKSPGLYQFNSYSPLMHQDYRPAHMNGVVSAADASLLNNDIYRSSNWNGTTSGTTVNYTSSHVVNGTPRFTSISHQPVGVCHKVTSRVSITPTQNPLDNKIAARQSISRTNSAATRPPFSVTKITKVRIELSGEFDPKNFLDRVPLTDTSGLEVPVWKRQLIARQLAEKAYKDHADHKRVADA